MIKDFTTKRFFMLMAEPHSHYFFLQEQQAIMLHCSVKESA